MKVDGLSPKSWGVGLLAILMLSPATSRAEAPSRLNSMDVLMHVRDTNCDVAMPEAGMITAATSPDTLIFNSRGCGPVLAADVHQLTLGQFKAAQGTASVKCINKGTHTVLHYSGLVPRGTYTVWLFIFANGGPPTPFTAVGALGSSSPTDPIQNFFTASASGEGELSLTNTAGTLSAVPGPIGTCWLDNPAVHLVLAYHIDGQTHGPTPGADETWVAQEVFMFQQRNKEIQAEGAAVSHRRIVDLRNLDPRPKGWREMRTTDPRSRIQRRTQERDGDNDGPTDRLTIHSRRSETPGPALLTL